MSGSVENRGEIRRRVGGRNRSAEIRAAIDVSPAVSLTEIATQREPYGRADLIHTRGTQMSHSPP